VIDKSLKLPHDRKIFDNSQPTYIINTVRESGEGNPALVRADPDNLIPSALNQLCNKGIQSLMVEGGASTLNDFIKIGLWDEARVFTGNKSFHSGIRAPQLNDQELTERREIGDDILHIYKRINR
jgi:diaminohydroxyphosphoribosylaminopyrimidine deaminase/5-amino-6-(5-phosphoribosylamino)uracil reductase